MKTMREGDVFLDLDGDTIQLVEIIVEITSNDIYVFLDLNDLCKGKDSVFRLGCKKLYIPREFAI